eukprot:scaffold24311_cov196-Cylindrotheca_fusiformis.AAC.3
MVSRKASAVFSITLVLIAISEKCPVTAFVSFDHHAGCGGNQWSKRHRYSAASRNDNLAPLEQETNASMKESKTKGARQTASSVLLDPGQPIETAAKPRKTKQAKGSTRKATTKSTATKARNGDPAKKTQTTKGKEVLQPSFWLLESDVRTVDFHNSKTAQGVSLLHFKIRGNPRPLRRHRTNFGRIYNPSEKLQESFRDSVREMFFSDLSLHPPIFEADEVLEMTIIFRLKRPKKHFVGGKPGPGRMRENAPPQTAPTRTDVDNLTKFVFDSMNEILYQDDRQIFSLQVTKILDNEDMCEGSTEILLRSIDDKDITDLVAKPLAISRTKKESSD